MGKGLYDIAVPTEARAPKLPKLPDWSPSPPGQNPTGLPPGAENRKRPRITTDELNQRGVAAIQEKWPDLPTRLKGLQGAAPDQRGALEKAFDLSLIHI